MTRRGSMTSRGNMNFRGNMTFRGSDQICLFRRVIKNYINGRRETPQKNPMVALLEQTGGGVVTRLL